MRINTQAFWPIAEISSPHGIQGKLSIRSFSGEIHHLEQESLWVGRQADSIQCLTVESCQNHKQGVLIRFKTIDTMEKAEALVGSRVWLAAKDFAPLEPNEIYIKDLLGCQLCDGEGNVIGKVKGYLESSCQTVLQIEVQCESQKYELEIPFCSAYFGKFDSENKKLDIHDLKDYIEGMEVLPIP